ncbi:MAG: CHC2 zinc finger domain-containing protein, partial [Planctomycetota bacterium]
MATNSDIDRVRETADLVALIGEHIPLRPKGREHVGVCPFHDDHSPSLTVVTHKGNAFYKCHACGASGDVFNFVMD